MRQRGGSEQPVKGQHANRSKVRKGSTATSSIADLQRQIGTLTRQLKEANERQTASDEVLRIVASSPENLQPIFHAMLEKAIALCEAKFGILFLYDGRAFTLAADRNLPPAFAQAVHGRFFSAETNTGFRRLVESKAPVHITDMFADSSYTQGEPLRVAAIELGGVRSFLAVPLLRKGELIGNFSIYRGEPGGFDENQIALAKTFADQAVIAIENARLLNDTKEALERQTATAEVLRVIASSPSDLQPVFEAIATRSKQLVGGHSAAVSTFVGDIVHLGAFTSVSLEADAALKALYPRRLADYPLFELARGGEVAQVSNIETDTRVPSAAKATARVRGYRSVLWVPMNSDTGPIGVITVTRKEPGTFAAQHIQLLQTFADQAVIAISNVELFQQVQNRTKELSEALQFQTAASDVLKVISRSPDKLQPVLDAIVETSRELCGSEAATILLLHDDGKLHFEAIAGTIPKHLEDLRNNPRPIDEPGSLYWRLFREKRTLHFSNVMDEPELGQSWVRLGGPRALLVTPLLNKGEVIGAIVLRQSHLKPFTERQIQAIEVFADQAIIAISNVGLFEQVQARTRDLQASLEQQTATAEILSSISASMNDTKPVFDAIAKSLRRLFDAPFALVQTLDGDTIKLAAVDADAGVQQMFRARYPRTLSGESVGGIAMQEKRTVQFHPLVGNPAVPLLTQQNAREFDFRALLFNPMLSGDKVVGAIGVGRREAIPFDDKQIALIASFANQAVIAIENTRLLRELRERTDDLTEALVYQTGSSNILKVIASSPTDVGPALKAIVESACEICGAYDALVFLKDGDDLVFAAHHGPIPIKLERWPINRKWITGRALADKAPQHIQDVYGPEGEDFPEGRELSRHQGSRTVLCVPLLQEDEAIGVISLRRVEVHPFNKKQIELLQSFADQAVIAISNVRLFEEVQAKTRDLEEALQQQTATSEVLQVISYSPGDLAPVFDKMLENATRVCGAEFGSMYLVEDDSLRQAALYNAPAALAAARSNKVFRPHPLGTMATAIRTRQVVQVEDVRTTPAYLERIPYAIELAELGGARTVVNVPMLRENELIGAITIYRQEVRAFSDKQIQLLSNFAKQAVIAIENARLLKELRQRTTDLQESLQQQTATADVLKVIASSPTEVGPVLQAIVESACQLCESDDATVALKDGHDLVFKAQHGSIPVVWDRLPINRQMVTGRAVIDAQPVHVRDLYGTEGEGFPDAREFARQTDVRTVLSVPLLREGERIGVITLRRTKVEPFSDKQINLLQTFADQAVIAIGNVRLFDEVQAKTRDLEESLEQQTATSEVLGAISSSLEDLAPLFQKILENATRVSGAEFGAMNLCEDDKFVTVAVFNVPEEYKAVRLNRSFKPHPKSGLGRAAVTHRPIQIEDIRTQPPYLEGNPAVVALSDIGGARTHVVVPLLKEDTLVGAISIYRQEVNPFNDKQITLLSNFAKQAVIAIENNRLLKELRQSLQQQTATADVLKVISRSTFDLRVVLHTLVESAAKLADADKATITRQREGVFYRAESYGFSQEFMDYVRTVQVVPERSSASGRAVLEGTVVHIPDVKADQEYTFNEAQRLGDYRAILAVPMLREGSPVGVIVLTRTEPRAFTDKQIELVTTFADQAAIAIENVRLFDQVQARTRELSQSLDELRTAQDRLIQTEKLASLGQLTAGIAHEIKNPLNFVNNFSALSVELTDELNDLLKQAALADQLRKEVDELTALLKSNLEKVMQHGKRADSIVKNMLLHSRHGSGERRSADINALVDESLNLAYHGARAEKQGFHITLERDYDPEAGLAHIYPQEVSRVLLNLISNGFYAATRAAAGNGFEPMLKAATRNLGDKVEIRIRDNGMGIPPEIREKIFNPFFTTKPAGEGTGLGLSMSHDIVVKQHGGTIELLTEPGSFTEFIVTLPRVLP